MTKLSQTKWNLHLRNGCRKKKREERRPGPRSLECTIPFSEATQLDEMETSGARRDTASIAPWRIRSLVLRRSSPAWKYNRANIIPPAWRDGGMPENKSRSRRKAISTSATVTGSSIVQGRMGWCSLWLASSSLISRNKI